MAALTHLDPLEADSIQIFRKAVAESERPVMLSSIGKDRSVMLHLAMKAPALSRAKQPRQARERSVGSGPSGEASSRGQRRGSESTARRVRPDPLASNPATTSPAMFS